MDTLEMAVFREKVLRQCSPFVVPHAYTNGTRVFEFTTKKKSCRCEVKWFPDVVVVRSLIGGSVPDIDIFCNTEEALQFVLGKLNY